MSKGMSAMKTSSMIIRIVAFALVFLLSCSAPLQNVSAYDPTFAHSGNAYVYSNNPEAVTGSGYTINKYLTANSYYDVEFYHRVISLNMQVGIAIKNHGTSTATVTVSASAKGQGADAALVAATVERDYWNGLGSKTMTISPNGAQWVLLVQNLGMSDTAVGKARLKSDTSNVEIRVVFGPQPDGASVVMDYPIAGSDPASGYSGQTTGYFSHDALTASYTYSSSDPSFVLPGWDPNLPTTRNEYEAAVSGHGPSGPLGGTNVVVPGNYGEQYTITISGASGKSLKIQPKPGYRGTIVVQTPGSSWTYYDIPAYSYQNLSISSSSWVLGVVQPGGNNSNFTFTVF